MRGIRVLLSLFSVVLFSMAVAGGQNNGAMLYAHGNVTVNGQSLAASTSIFAGDRLDTADSSVATINRRGSSVVVNPNSSVEYGQSSIVVMHGTARVSTLAGMSARAGQVVISPTNGNAKFDVPRTSEGTVVVPREGSLVVHDGDRTVNLQPGASRMFASTSQAEQTIAEQSAAGVVPHDGIHTYETGMQGGLPICPNVSYCFGRGSASQIQPCSCH